MRKLLFSNIKNYLSLFRISQWFKNIFVFVPLVFSHNLFTEKFFISVKAFLAFSIASSISYIINDLFDYDLDKNHPVKKNRPITSGRVTKKGAVLSAVLLFAFLFILAWEMNSKFISVLGLYLLINFLYSTLLKNISILEILTIAFGFMLRIIGGAYVINVSLSSWLILTTLFLSLFLAINKRIAEINISGTTSRKVLEFYSREYLNQISSISTTGIIICYSLYTVSERTIKEFNTENLVFTTVFVVFGIFRYLLILNKENNGENIIETIFNDFPSILNIFLYIITILILIY